MREHAGKLLQCARRLREDPASADALFTLTVIYALEGHRAKALRFLRRLEALVPAYPGLGELKGRVLKLAPRRLRRTLSPSGGRH